MTGSSLSDPFLDLLARAGHANAIRTLPSHTTAPARFNTLSESGLTSVRAGQPVQFRCTLPSWMETVQALMFERDATGIVTLVSHGVLLGSDVWYRREVVVPRQDALLNNAGAMGRIRLTVRGRSTLLLICCRDRRVRFDKLPFFDRTAAWWRPGPVPHEPVSAEELRKLQSVLMPLPAGSWMVLAGTIVVGRP
jgi:hypothetical protein